MSGGRLPFERREVTPEDLDADDEETQVERRPAAVKAGASNFPQRPLGLQSTRPAIPASYSARMRQAPAISPEGEIAEEWINSSEVVRASDVERQHDRASLKPIHEADRPDADWLGVGETVAERYCVQRVLGIGGMGLVVEAFDLREARVVALKFLRPSLCVSGDIQKRFMREMRTLCKLSSDHALHVFESGRHRAVPYIVTEFLSGETTLDRLRRKEPLPVQQVVGWIIQACDALAEAHRNGIVHRDLKPENLFLQRLGSEHEIVKVLDFGISKAPTQHNSDVEVITRTHVIMGSPFYMPPEQLAASKDVDERSDVWALGITLFELLTGTLPFKAATVEDLAREILTTSCPRARNLRPDLPPALEAVIQHCVERERVNRYQSVAELARALSPFGAPECVALVERIRDRLGFEPGRGEEPASVARPGGAALGNDVPSDDRYRALLPLGEGGSAKVTLAVTQDRFKKLVVLKSLLKSLADEADFVRMFVTEARLSSRLNHPNVIRVNDVFLQGGVPTLVMEYLEGQPLSVIRTRAFAELPLELHLWMLCEVLAGLHYAHESTDYDGSTLHLVHRDVSPQNVFVTYDGQVKVLDFGIAKAAGLVGHTRTGVVKGKVRYMAPEQISGEELDRRVDIFAVGVMLWEAATRQRLWRGLSEGDVMRRIARGDIPAPTEVSPGCPAELTRICMKALAHDRDERYQTAADLRCDLEEFLSTRAARLAAKRVTTFMQKHFGAECERVRHRVHRLLADMTSTPAVQSSAQRLASPAPGPPPVSSPWRETLAKLDAMSPRRAMLYGAIVASIVTWALTSSLGLP